MSCLFTYHKTKQSCVGNYEANEGENHVYLAVKEYVGKYEVHEWKNRVYLIDPHLSNSQEPMIQDSILLIQDKLS